MQTTGMPLDVRLAALEPLAEGVLGLTLHGSGDAVLPAWQPGAHIDLLLPSGRVRQYSLCGDPRERAALRIAVLREAAGRGGSQEVHDTLRPGQRLQIVGPRNAFPLVPAARLQFVAGGIGITPILTMLREAQRLGADWHLVYGGRSLGSMAFVDELQRLGGARVELRPADRCGLLDLEAIVVRAAQGAVTHACGPAPLLDALAARFTAAGLSDLLHVERFTPAAVSNDATRPLRVHLARRGAVVDVPAGCSVLHALRAAGHDVPSSCEQGVCGQCETRVLAGIPEHHDQLLTETERRRGDRMMLCVSRAMTPELTLDL